MPTVTLPTYATAIPGVLQWAVDRELLHPDGTANRATAQGQHGKTVEEIDESSLELRKLAKTKAIAERLMKLPTNEPYAVAVLHRRKHRLALELGDVLVTLAIQASMQGATLERCRFESGRLCASYGIDWVLGTPARPPLTWQFVEHHSAMLGLEIANDGDNAPAYIGAVALCVEEIARIELSMLGPECMALALAKIQGRSGEVVGGVYVKAGS
jgi:hypothetical protein